MRALLSRVEWRRSSGSLPVFRVEMSGSFCTLSPETGGRCSWVSLDSDQVNLPRRITNNRDWARHESVNHLCGSCSDYSTSNGVRKWRLETISRSHTWLKQKLTQNVIFCPLLTLVLFQTFIVCDAHMTCVNAFGMHAWCPWTYKSFI